ncbi:MAG: recombinase family protein [bacterium]
MADMRCAIYARYSSDAQNPRSLDDQIRECENKARHQGWTVLDGHIYRDAAESGSNVDRHAYLRLKESARRGEFDCILVDDLSRLGRDVAESASIFNELNRLGVRIVGVADGIDTSNPSAKIPFYFKGIMNELFLDDLKAKIVRGLKGQVLRGYSAGGRVYGYQTNQIFDPSGATDKFGRPKRIGCEVLVDEEQAGVIRRIFEMRRSGHGYRSIADRLNSDGIPSPHQGCGRRAGYWGASTIRTLLKQQKYLGDWTWNKTKWLNKQGSGPRLKRSRPASDWVVFKSENLRIVSDELWLKAHECDQYRSNRSGGRRGSYLLSGLIKCSECGASMVVQNSTRYSCYMCNGYRNGGRSVCDNNHRVSRGQLEKAFLCELTELLTNPTTATAIVKEAKRISKGVAERANQNHRSLQDTWQEVSQQVKSLLDFIQAGDSSTAVRQRLAQKEAELVILELRHNASMTSDAADFTITTDWILDKLNNLNSVLKTHVSDVGSLKRELFILFPGGLEVSSTLRGDHTEFRVKGTAKPMQAALLSTSIMNGSGAGI